MSRRHWMVLAGLVASAAALGFAPTLMPGGYGGETQGSRSAR